MDFLYFIPGRQAADRKTINATGLAYAIPDGIATAAVPAGGPGGLSGVLVARADSDVRLAFAPEDQVWTKMPVHLFDGDHTPWAGYWKAHPPTAGDLVRGERDTVDGYQLELGDDDSPAGPQTFVIPLARVFPSGTQMPQRMAIGPDGKVVRKPLERFAEACRDAERIFDALAAEYGYTGPDQDSTSDPQPDVHTDDVEQIDDDEAFRLACRILGINYRLGPAEVSALGLLTTENVKLVLGWFVDLPTFLQVHRARQQAAADKATAKKNDDDSHPPCGGD